MSNSTKVERADEDDMRDLDSSLRQAERLLIHAMGHLRDAVSFAEDEHHKLGLTAEKRAELNKLLKHLQQTTESVIVDGSLTRPILDGANQ